MACYSGFLAGREAARLMLPRGKGNIFFTGATASLRGGSGYAAFASAKFGLRAVAQAMARELGPKNIHVAHLIIDSGVDTEWVRQRRIEALGQGSARQSRSADAAVLGRGVLLAALSAAAQRLDVRAGNSPVRREVVAGARVRRQHGRPGDLHLRQRRAEEEVSAAHRQWRRLVVPGLFGAGLRLRPRLAQDQGRARRRPLHRQRPEDLDHAGPARRLDLLPGAHRSRRPSRRRASPSC
jgi:short-subunit dehydrogenase